MGASCRKPRSQHDRGSLPPVNIAPHQRENQIKGDACSSEVIALSQANNHLAANLHRLLAEERGNVFFSPYSISTAMGMLLCAARGETEVEMRSSLGYDHARISREDVAAVFNKQMSLLAKSKDSYILSCANSMLIRKGYDIKDDFKVLLEKSFTALLMEIDFVTENQKCVTTINEWVKSKTNDMIPKLVDSVDPATVMILLNAVYFKGTWNQQFEEEYTYAQDFYNGGYESVSKVQMMCQKNDFFYAENEAFQALQLPYIGKDVAMLVLLPRKRDGITELEASLSANFMQDIKGTLRERSVEVALPKFRLEYSKSLVSCFQKLGINRAFSRGAELGGASDSTDLFVSEMLHKAVVEVNEEGSEAAATMVTFVYCSGSFSATFIADHPFLFIIYDTRSDMILFMGRVDEL